MNEVTNIQIAVPTLEDIWSLQAAASQFPQIELPTEHYFANGMYCRKITMPKGSLVVGKVHTSLHLFMCVKGACTVWTELESRNFVAGDVAISQPGTKRVLLMLEDTVCITMHKTDKTDVAELEKELTEEDLTSMYTVGNVRKDWSLAPSLNNKPAQGLTKERREL